MPRNSAVAKKKFAIKEKSSIIRVVMMNCLMDKEDNSLFSGRLKGKSKYVWCNCIVHTLIEQ